MNCASRVWPVYFIHHHCKKINSEANVQSMPRTVEVVFGLSILFTIIAKWRIQTMVLPELSRTMAYTTLNTVNRIARKELNSR